MRQALIKLEEFIIRTSKGERNIVFSQGFMDSEFKAWRSTDESLTLIYKDDSEVTLTYNPRNNNLEGRNSLGTSVVIEPTLNNVKDFREALAVKRKAPVWETTQEEKPALQVKNPFAVVSKFPFSGVDHYTPDKDLMEMLDKLFDEGYQKVVYSEVPDAVKVGALLVDDQFEVTFYHQAEVKRWILFCITRDGWQKMRFRRKNLNFFGNIKENLTRAKASYGHVEKDN